MKITVDLSGVKKAFADNRKLKSAVMDDAYQFFKKATPIRTGNARRNTYLASNRDRIVGDYPYAQRLDEGYSNQAPDGMTGPTEDYINRRVTAYLNRTGSK